MSLLVCLNFTSTIDKMVILLEYQQNRFMQPHPPQPVRERLFVLGKTKRVLLPYLIVGVFHCLLQDRDMEQMLYGVSHLWFLVVIFECYMIGKVFDSVLWIKEKQRRMLMMAIVFFMVFISYRLSGTRILCETQLVKYLPFYMMGMLMAKVNVP